MKIHFLKVVLLCAGVFFIYSCIDPFNPPSTLTNANYLVVDGFLNSTDSSCIIKLSRTIALNAENIVPMISNAQVSLTSESGETLALTEDKGTGVYSGKKLAINVNQKYSLNITTPDNKQYASAMMPVLQSPAIDTLTWSVQREGIQVEVTAHDGDNSARYYQWDFIETWAYKSAYNSVFKLGPDNSLVLRGEDIYRCYMTKSSTDIVIGSSSSLDRNTISKLPVTTATWQTPKTLIKYSALVRQRAITQDTYDYLVQVKKTNTNLGTLFDPLPARVIGNIKSLSDPNEPVIGYFTAGSTQSKRIFVDAKEFTRPDVTPITGYEGCEKDTVRLDRLNLLLREREIIEPAYKDVQLVGYVVAPKSCVDCRVLGGTNIKPDFWK